MKRNKFSLSSYKLLSCDMGQLIPVCLEEVLPGDTFQHSTSLLARVSPLLAPVMHPVTVNIHHWFVPFRLLWDKWEDFITGGADGMQAPTFPYATSPAGTGYAVGSLADYLGCPTGVPSQQVSVLPFRAYTLIYNEFYRDEDLQTKLTFFKSNGNDSATNTALQNVNWEKDYFTSARPWEQKGPAVTIPLTGNAPIIETPGTTAASKLENAATGAAATSTVLAADASGNMEASTGGYDIRLNPNGTMQADLSGVSAVNMNDLREAMGLQRLEEARARYGSRYVEYLRYYGVRSSDARLQRPEYLGGGKQTIQFSEVLSTAETTDTPVGSLKGHGIAAMRSNKYRRYFEEHGYVMTLMFVRPKTMYVQGLPRTWNRRTKLDFYQKELEHIGQQHILNKEIYAAHTTPEGVFGYQDRYDEYRRSISTIAGEFRTTLLDFWHMARIFASDPALNDSFVRSNPTKRINAIQNKNTLWIMANNKIAARRMLSKSGGNSFIN